MIVIFILSIFAVYNSAKSIYKNILIYQLNFNYNLKQFKIKQKFEYTKLKPTNLFFLTKYIIKNKNQLYMNKYINNNLDYILSLSKFIDKTIKTNIKFRSKNNRILIDEIAKLIVTNTIILQKPVLFKLVKFYVNKYKINKKELNIIKILITKYLFCVLFKNYIYSIRVNKTINTYSNTRHFNLKTTNTIKQYSLICFNKNYSKFIHTNNNYISSFLMRQVNIFNTNKLIVLYLINLYKS